MRCCNFGGAEKFEYIYDVKSFDTGDTVLVVGIRKQLTYLADENIAYFQWKSRQGTYCSFISAKQKFGPALREMTSRLN